MTISLPVDDLAGHDRLRVRALPVKLRELSLRQREIIGEAMNRLRKADPEVAQRIPDLSRIVGLRNILAHGYLVVVDVVLWSAVSERMLALLTVVEEPLDEIS